MSLPKIDYPIHSIKVPSLNKNYSFRPFLVKEEKLLLMAKESETDTDFLSVIKQVVNNCLIDKLDINKLSIFDLEYVFLKLRAVSVDNKVKLSYKDNEDNKLYEFEIDLNEIDIKYPEKKIDNVIKITPKIGMTMKHPSASLYDDKEFLSLEKDYMFELILRCIENIFVEDEIYNVKDYKKQDLEEFLENLDIKTFEAVNDFLLNAPKIEHVIKYKNELGNERKIVLSSLNDFFSLR
jgi:hypothetical protein